MSKCKECDYLHYDTIEPCYVMPMCTSGGFILREERLDKEGNCKCFTLKGTREKIDLNDANTLENLTLYCKMQGFDVDEYIKFLKKVGEVK